MFSFGLGLPGSASSQSDNLYRGDVRLLSHAANQVGIKSNHEHDTALSTKQAAT